MKFAATTAALLSIALSAAGAQAAGATPAGTTVDTATRALAAGKWHQSVFWSEKALHTPGLSTADTVKALTSLCVAQSKLNRFGEAWNTCDKAVTAGPAEWTSYINRGNLRLLTGDLIGAKADYARAKELNPTNPVAQAAVDLRPMPLSVVTASFVGLGAGGTAVAQTASSNKTGTGEQ